MFVYEWVTEHSTWTYKMLNKELLRYQITIVTTSSVPPFSSLTSKYSSAAQTMPRPRHAHTGLHEKGDLNTRFTSTILCLTLNIRAVSDSF